MNADDQTLLASPTESVWRAMVGMPDLISKTGQPRTADGYSIKL